MDRKPLVIVGGQLQQIGSDDRADLAKGLVAENAVLTGGNLTLGTATPGTHRLELANGNTPAAGIKQGDCEFYRGDANQWWTNDTIVLRDGKAVYAVSPDGTKNVQFFHSNSTGYLLANNYLTIQSVNNIGLSTFNVYCDFGGMWYFRDKDASGAVRVQINSATGDVDVLGKLTLGSLTTGTHRLEIDPGQALPEDGVAMGDCVLYRSRASHWEMPCHLDVTGGYLTVSNPGHTKSIAFHADDMVCEIVGDPNLSFWSVNGGPLSFVASGLLEFVAGTNVKFETGPTGSIIFKTGGSFTIQDNAITSVIYVEYDVPGELLSISGGLSLQKSAHFTLEHDNGNSGTAATIDLANGNHQRLTMTGNCTLTLNSPGVCNCTLKVIQDATGGRTLTLPTGTKKAGGTVTLSTAAAAVDLLTIYYDGTDYYVAIVKDFK